MNVKAAVLATALGVVQGCGDPTVGPAPPTALPVTERCPSASCQLIPFHISGVATDDDGRPVTGAKVSIRPFVFGQSPPAIITSTDSAGFYRVEFEGQRDAAGGVGGAIAELPDHERHWRYLGPSYPQEI